MGAAVEVAFVRWLRRPTVLRLVDEGRLSGAPVFYAAVEQLSQRIAWLFPLALVLIVAVLLLRPSGLFGGHRADPGAP